jgi:ubiquinone/menaquinone biosynthesis C-methylase UbiE
MRTIRAISTVVMIVLAGVAAAVAQNDSADHAWLAEALRIGPGSVVADVGAGPEAPLTIPMAGTVGPSGRVYATDIGDTVRKLRERVRKADLQNVEIIEGGPSSTNLPAECCDAIFIRNVYHHFAEPAAMNASLLQSLKPGGRLAIIDFRPRGGREASSPEDRDQGDQHGVSRETVAKELVQAGFELVTSEDRAKTWFVVVVAKPAK